MIEQQTSADVWRKEKINGGRSVDSVDNKSFV